MEIPGHIANRLQAAVWREAIDLVLNGVASVADVDKALVAGPGMRWALLGAHMIFHLGGGSGGIEYFVKHVGRSFDALWNDMASWDSLPPETAETLRDGLEAETSDRSLDDLVRWRDEKTRATAQDHPRSTGADRMLNGKTALVTGSTRGIGLSIAIALAEHGASVILNGFGDVEEAKTRVSKSGCPVRYHGADMSKPDEIVAMIDYAETEMGGLDILVNNAGIQ